MMSDVNVTFGADTARLKAGLDEARKNLSGFAPGAALAAKASIDALNASMAQTNALAGNLTFETAQASIDQARASTALLTQTLVDANAAARAMKTTWSEALFNAAAFSPITAAISAFQDYAASVAYSQRGTELFTQANEGMIASIGRSVIASREYWDVTGRVGRALSEAANNIRLYFLSGLDETQIKAIEAAGALAAFDEVLSRSGLSSKQFLVEETKKLEAIPGLGDEAATSIVAMMTTIPNYSAEAQDVLTQFLVTFAKTSDEALKLTKVMTDAFRDPTNGGAILGDLAKQVENVEGQLKLAATYAQRLTPDQAVAMYDRIEQRLKDSVGHLAEEDANRRRILSTLILENGEEEGAAGLIREQLALDQKRTSELNAQILSLEAQRQGWVAISAEAKQQAEYVEAIGKASTPTSRINDLESTKKTLTSNSRREREDDITPAEKDAAIRVAILEAANQTDEGLLAVLNVMSNRLHATYGDYGDTLGQVVSKNAAFSAYDPAKMAAINPDSFQYKRTAGLYDKVFGDDPSEDPSKGATHYYNPSSAQPNWATGMGNVNKIGAHTFGNPDGQPVPSADQSTISAEAVAQTNTQLREQKALLDGGTEEEKQTAEQAKLNLTTARNEVAEAQALVETRRKAAAAANDGSPQEKARSAKAVTDAEQSLLDKQRAQRKASDDLEIAQAREGSKQQLDLRLAEMNTEQTQYAAGSAKYIEIEKQKYEATKKYQQAQRDDAVATADADFANQKRRAAEADEITRAKAKVGEISQAEERATLNASLAAQLAAQRAYLQAKMALYADEPKEYRKYQTQLAEIDETNNATRIKAALAANEQIYASYKATFERVGSTISSSLTAIIERTGTWRQLMQNIAKQVLSMFVDAGVKMVADWASRQAASVAITVASQTQQTLAVATGEAARLGAVVSGAVASAATTSAAIFKNITASGAETFAGIFGFLAPVLGPAAAGPAAAGQAAVIASMPSFAVGAWSLPSDMVAQVHAGEMIVPAGPAGAMRAALSGGNNTGAGQGGHTFNIAHTSYGSRSPEAIKAESQIMIKQIMNDMVTNRQRWQTGLNKVI